MSTEQAGPRGELKRLWGVKGSNLGEENNFRDQKPKQREYFPESCSLELLPLTNGQCLFTRL